MAVEAEGNDMGEEGGIGLVVEQIVGDGGGGRLEVEDEVVFPYKIDFVRDRSLPFVGSVFSRNPEGEIREPMSRGSMPVSCISL